MVAVQVFQAVVHYLICNITHIGMFRANLFLSVCMCVFNLYPLSLFSIGGRTRALRSQCKI